jgi:hypothetical protein
MGRQGLAHPRWMVGGTRCLLVHPWGGVVGGACATAHGADTTVQWLGRQCAAQRMVLSETACPAAEGDPSHRTRWPRGAWQAHVLVETGLSRLTLLCPLQPVRHRGWASCPARLACTMAACTVWGQWHGGPPTASGFVPLSIAALSL